MPVTLLGPDPAKPLSITDEPVAMEIPRLVMLFGKPGGARDRNEAWELCVTVRPLPAEPPTAVLPVMSTNGPIIAVALLSVADLQARALRCLVSSAAFDRRAIARHDPVDEVLDLFIHRV